LVSFTTPFVLSVFAHSLASMWIEQQTRGRDGSLPTPAQYGHLVGLCGAFGLSSVYDAGKYLALGRKKRPSAPMALVAAFLAALVALVINYALSRVLAHYLFRTISCLDPDCLICGSISLQRRLTILSKRPYLPHPSHL
jgi:hypothetical protein